MPLRQSASTPLDVVELLAPPPPADDTLPPPPEDTDDPATPPAPPAPPVPVVVLVVVVLVSLVVVDDAPVPQFSSSKSFVQPRLRAAMSAMHRTASVKRRV